MPYEIRFENRPAGIALNSARQATVVEICAREFTSSEDGDVFISRLEGIGSDILNRLPPNANVAPSVVDHMLAVCRRDATATVYVNELSATVTVRAKRRAEAGDKITIDDIADIERLTYLGVEIPKDAGVVLLLSHGWRKGFYFDFSPLHGTNAVEREYDCAAVFGRHLAYLMFQDLFKISDTAWGHLFSQRWFPFISLRTETIRAMIRHAAEGWPVDDILGQIAGDLNRALDGMLAKWRDSPSCAAHIAVLETAVERYRAADYVSAAHILFPRIEGIMRTHHSVVAAGTNAGQGSLVTSATSSVGQQISEASLLLPARFRRYLQEIYFGHFDPNNPADPLELSRNTVAHGVAPAERFSLKGAVIGLLLLDQLSYYIQAVDEPRMEFLARTR